MAIIPVQEKVFMVSNGTNTTYGGSAALQAMNQWYTMQDVIDTVGGGGTPTLQEVTTAGNTTDQTINITGYTGTEGLKIDAVDSVGIKINQNGDFTGILVVNGGGGTNPGIDVDVDTGIGIRANSDGNSAGYFTSAFSSGPAIYASSTGNVGVYGSGDGGGGSFNSVDSVGVYGYSETDYGVQGTSADGSGVIGSSNSSYGVIGSSQNSAGGYFSTSVEEGIALVSAGAAAKPGGGLWDAYSDARLKENIKPYTKGLNDLLLINAVNYEYNGLAGTKKGSGYVGIIAQEMKEIFPDTVNTYKAKLNEDDKEDTELYKFNGSELTFALINAVKELKAEIDLLKSK